MYTYVQNIKPSSRRRDDSFPTWPFRRVKVCVPFGKLFLVNSVELYVYVGFGDDIEGVGIGEVEEVGVGGLFLRREIEDGNVLSRVSTL